MEKEIVVKPGKVYLVIGISIIGGCVICGIYTLIEKIYELSIIYISIAPIYILFASISLLFYKRTRIILKEEIFFVQPFWGKRKQWSYTQVTQVIVYEHVGLSRPIVLMNNHKKIAKVVAAYSNYNLIEQIFTEKCRDRIAYF